MTWASPSRVLKPDMRDYLVSSDRPFRRALFLPGWDDQANTGCLCVRRALELGAITLDSKIIAVERVSKLAPKIIADLDSIGFRSRPRFHAGELADLVLSPSQLDFGMLDLLGTLNIQLAHWIEETLGPALTTGATLAFTMTRHFRNNRFMENMTYAWKRSPQLRRHAFQYANLVGIEQDEELIHHVIIKSCLCRFSLGYRPVQIYRDHRRTMVAFRFDNIHLASSSWPSLEEVMLELDRL